MDWTEALPGALEIGDSEVHLWRYPATGSDKTGTLHQILAGYLECRPADVALEHGPHGKPRLALNPERLCFNQSDSGDWRLVAIARVEVGVDIEQINTERATEKLTGRFLAPGEQDLVRARSDTGAAAFFTVWSRKEAYLKAVGVGLAVPFSRIDSSGARLPELDDAGSQIPGATPWAVQELLVDDQHPATVVARTDKLFLRGFTLRRSVP